MRCCNTRRRCDCYGCTSPDVPHCDPRPTWRERLVELAHRLFG